MPYFEVINPTPNELVYSFNLILRINTPVLASQLFKFKLKVIYGFYMWLCFVLLVLISFVLSISYVFYIYILCLIFFGLIYIYYNFFLIFFYFVTLFLYT